MSGGNDYLRDAIMAVVDAAGGVVIVNGERMIKREVVRSVMRYLIIELFSDVRERSAAVVADDAEAAKQLAAELDESERRIEKFVTEMLPVLN